MERIVNLIKNHATKDKPISNKEICSQLFTNEISVRKYINKARCEGIPICSNSQGYYYSEAPTDILETMQSLMHRTLSVERAINGLMATIRGTEDISDE
jgi:biotin operon repressor